MPKTASTKKGSFKARAETEKGKTTKTTGVRTSDKGPARKVKPQTPPVERISSSPIDQSYVLNDLLAESRNSDEQVSLGAIDRLGRMEDPRATACLTSCLKDTRFIVRIYAAAQLGERHDAAAVESLIEALDDESVFVRQTVAGALEHIGGDRALRAVKEAETQGLLLNELPEGKRLGPLPEE
jgi:hypothetical protein